MLDNIYETESHAMAWSIAEVIRPAIALFDFAAAFPSVIHQWLQAVLSRLGLPLFMLEAIKALYSDCLCVIYFGRRH
eukprot:5688248-Heterocapsa_arctica.AAC.1